MKVLNNPPRKTTCKCGAELEYNNNDIKHGKVVVIMLHHTIKTVIKVKFKGDI